MSLLLVTRCPYVTLGDKENPSQDLASRTSPRNVTSIVPSPGPGSRRGGLGEGSGWGPILVTLPCYVVLILPVTMLDTLPECPLCPSLLDTRSLSLGTSPQPRRDTWSRSLVMETQKWRPRHRDRRVEQRGGSRAAGQGQGQGLDLRRTLLCSFVFMAIFLVMLGI